MKMTWSVGPKPQRVRLEVSITGQERVWVDGMPISQKTNRGACSEYDVPLVGHKAKLLVRSNGMAARGELFVDGQREEPDWRPVEPQPPSFDASPSAQSSQVSTWSIGISVAASALGAMLGRSLGFALLIPAAFWMITSLIGSWLAPARSRPLVPAVGLLGGHLGWMAMGIVAVAQNDLLFDQENFLAGLFLEIGVFSVLGIILLASASPLAILATGLLEFVAITVNLGSLGAAGVGNEMAKALSMALVLRGGIIVLLVVGWRQLNEPEPAPAPLEGPLGPRRGTAVGDWTNCSQCGLEHRVGANLRCPRCDVAYVRLMP